MAITLIDNYRPLVEIMVLNSAGQLVARQGMNADIINRFPDPWSPSDALTEHFLGFLADAAREARDRETSSESPTDPAPGSAQDTTAPTP